MAWQLAPRWHAYTYNGRLGTHYRDPIFPPRVVLINRTRVSIYFPTRHFPGARGFAYFNTMMCIQKATEQASIDLQQPGLLRHHNLLYSECFIIQGRFVSEIRQAFPWHLSHE